MCTFRFMICAHFVFAIIIDSVNDEYQGELLKEIWSIVENSNVRSLISLRLTTFRRIEIGHGAYSYGVFQNAGADVIEILLKRLNYFLDNSDNEWFSEVKNNLDPNKLNLLTQRIKNIINILSIEKDEKAKKEKKDKRLRYAIQAMSGLSIRRCLYLSERFLINSSIEHTKTECNQDEYINALLIDDNQVSEININDDLITNVFASRTNSNSLLQIRILQILSDYRIVKKTMSLNELINILNCYYKWDSEDIYFAITNLIFYKKRLAYINGVSTYSEIKDMYNSKEDTIEITMTGYYYLKHLFDNLQYVQTCFYTLDWEIQNDIPVLINEKQGVNIFNGYLNQIKLTNPSLYNRLKNRSNLLSQLITDDDFVTESYFPTEINNNEIIERIAFIRKGIGAFLNMDLIQSLNHTNNMKNKDCPITARKELIMCTVVAQIGWSVFKILHPHRMEIDNQDEMKNWQSLLLLTDFWQTTIYQSASKELRRVVNVYSSALRKLKVNL